MNDRGFAITGLLYTIMMVFIVFTMMILFNLQNKKTILDELKADTVLALDDDASISAILDRLEVLENQNTSYITRITALENENKNWLNKTYPIGSIYISITNKNPKDTLGGTWVSWGSGRVPVGVDTSQSEFNAAEKTGGSKTEILNINQLPVFTPNLRVTYGIGDDGTEDYLSINFSSGNLSIQRPTYGRLSVTRPAFDSIGGGQAHNNLQPYITAYMWKRTA